MREEVARRVMNELEGNGYEPRLHEPEQEDGPFSISLHGHDFELGDFKTMTRVAEDFGLAMGMTDDGRITLRSV